jgi:hypothetical protein
MCLPTARGGHEQRMRHGPDPDRTKRDREERSHGEDYPGSSDADSPERQYGTPSGPDEQRPPDPGSKPKPAER